MAQYPFSGDAGDVSGNGHHGLIVGASLTNDRHGNTDQALYFDGVDDYITLGDLAILDIGPQDRRSISLWFAPDDPGDVGSGALITRGRETVGWDARWYMHYNYAEQRIRFQLQDGTSGDENGDVSSVASDSWHHLVIVFDRPADQLILYVDGVERHVHTIEKSGGFSNGNSVGIGATNDAPNTAWRDFYKGKIDDVMIFDGVLSEDNVTVLFSL